MYMLGFILRNLRRQPVNSGLTLAGLSIGIATVVSLGAMTAGVERSALQTIHAGDADFLVAQRTSAGLMFSSITEEDWRRIEAQEGVDLATGVVVFISRVDGDPYFRAIGIEPEQLAEVAPPIVEGRYLSADADDETVLGDQAAELFGVGVGDRVAFAGKEFAVVGITRTGNRWLDAGAFAPLATLQPLAAKPDLLTMIYVRVADAALKSDVSAGIRRDFEHLTTISNLSDFEDMDQGLRVIIASNRAVSIIAVALGALGIMTTMVRSVFERTRELGVLRAVGWRGRRVVAMVVGESLVLCAAATVVGAALGVAGATAAEASETVGSFVDPTYDPELFVRAAAIALVVALFGAVYPAVRAVRLEPVDALRSE
jgi:putative ABC transport system permease protein